MKRSFLRLTTSHGGDWTLGIRDYILGCSADGEGVANYLSLQKPERGEKMVFDLGHAAWKEGRPGPRATVYYAPNSVWAIERPYSFSLNCPQGVMTFCESMTMPEFIPWGNYDVLLHRFRRMENYYVDYSGGIIAALGAVLVIFDEALRGGGNGQVNHDVFVGKCQLLPAVREPGAPPRPRRGDRDSFSYSETGGTGEQ